MKHTKYPQIDTATLQTWSAEERISLVKTGQMAQTFQAGDSFKDFLKKMPRILKTNELLALAAKVVRARDLGKPVIVMLGGHVVKTGSSSLLIDLIREGFVTHAAANGSVAVHDTELARIGQTSEDVQASLEDGSFGMARDTADFINAAALRAYQEKLGFGQILGLMLLEENAVSAQSSLAAAAADSEIPFTLHIAMGTDIVHQHPSADGAAIGAASLRDFHILAATVSNLGQGGVVLNLGSAVIMPEVFLKCLAMARNVNKDKELVRDFTTANLDMLQHYRPRVNVLQRPVSLGGESFSLTGHHEIMIPLLTAAIHECAHDPEGPLFTDN